MTDSPVTLAHLAAVAAIASVVFGVINMAFRFANDFFTAKFAPSKSACPVDQSAQCKFDHANINSLIATQNDNIKTMLGQNSLQIAAFSNAQHASELRHQTVLNKLDAIHDHVKK